ncbi:MAG: c-type cytochrome [Burkholderiaceae bacterium]
MAMGVRCSLWCALTLLAGVAHAQTPPSEPLPPLSQGPFTSEMVEKGKAQFHRTCSHCHGLNMVNSGTTVYDLRKFPVDQPDRFLNSVTNGKGNMPSFKGALEPGAIQYLWSYVATRGGKEM